MMRWEFFLRSSAAAGTVALNRFPQGDCVDCMTIGSGSRAELEDLVEKIAPVRG